MNELKDRRNELSDHGIAHIRDVNMAKKEKDGLIFSLSYISFIFDLRTLCRR